MTTALTRHTITQLCCLSFIIALSAGSARASDEWLLVKNKDGMSVYATPVAGSDIIKVKVHAVIDAPIQHIQAILDNVEHRKNWIPYLRHSRILVALSDHERIEYSVFNAPWPASDRDFVYRITHLHNSRNRLVYAMRSETGGLMLEQAHTVRADLVQSVYTLTAADANQTCVELVFHSDLKGWLPGWFINIIQKELPFMILKNLRQQAQLYERSENREKTAIDKTSRQNAVE